ncbi:hypothetical protein WJX77_011057 [Trebouxia sp. C0004]
MRGGCLHNLKDYLIRLQLQQAFRYLSGDNEGRHKVAMTSPVTVQTTAGQGPACRSDFLVSFFLPHKYQESLLLPRTLM